MKKFMLRAIPVIAVLLVIVFTTVCPVWAARTASDIEGLAGGTGDGVDSVNKAVNRIWSTVLTVLQILAVAAVVFAGVKYMFAAAEDKAEIKQGLIGLAVGAILVFGASTIVQFILKASQEAGISNAG